MSSTPVPHREPPRPAAILDLALPPPDSKITTLNANEPKTVQELKDAGYEIIAEFAAKQAGASYVLTKGATLSENGAEGGGAAAGNPN